MTGDAFTSSTIDVGGLSIHSPTGDVGNPPLVLLHGLSGTPGPGTRTRRRSATAIACLRLISAVTATRAGPPATARLRWPVTCCPS
jgi:hypothetical protein